MTITSEAGVGAGIQTDNGLVEALDQGRTLPASWYTDPAIFALEQERIFGRSWQYVCLTEDLRRPGDFITAQAGKAPIVILRDDAGQLKAFVNVCRHRGSHLVQELRGNRKAIQCGYHAWTYGLDGGLRSAPGSDGETGFDPQAFSLFPAGVGTWGPFVFASPKADPPPIESILGTLPGLVEATGLDPSRIRRRDRREYEIAANWKVVIDNYLECYHCPTAHPAFCDLLDVAQYQVEEYEYFSTQTAPERKTRRKRPYEVGEGVTEGFYAYLWPNFTVNIYPGPGNVSLNLFIPIDAGHTRAIFDYCFVQEVSDEVVTEFASFVDQVQREDRALCESVQVGLSSGVFDQGTLMLSKERALRHFQKLVYKSVAS